MIAYKHTDPPFPSFRSASQTATANFKSPRMVENSAKRRCCVGGDAEGLLGPWWEEFVAALGGSDETEGDGLCMGAGDGEGEPKRRRVDENKRDGSRRVEENYNGASASRLE